MHLEVYFHGWRIVADQRQIPPVAVYEDDDLADDPHKPTFRTFTLTEAKRWALAFEDGAAWALKAAQTEAGGLQ